MTQVAPQGTHPDDGILLRELDHRIINEFTSAISAVSLAVARTHNDEAKGALSAVAQLLHHYADVHRALQMPAPGKLVDAAAYLGQLFLSISRSKLAYREIGLELVAEPLRIEAYRCWRLGMMLHELINNASEHAFAAGSGRIRVELAPAGAFVMCKVMDNGSAAGSVLPGRGLKIVRELAKGLGARFEQSFGTEGSMSVITFPLELRTQDAAEQTIDVAARAAGC